MQLITDLASLSIEQPCGITIGTFDGVHLGHQALLRRLREKLPPNGRLVVFTFANHPSQHFTPDNPAFLICTPKHRTQLLGEYGADIVILHPFTAEFSRTPFDQFLKTLKEKLNFSELVLGKGATFGKNREGKEENVRRMAQELHFEVEYLDKAALHDTPLSSGRIRKLISHGEFHKVQECLGRPYSILGGFPHFDTAGLCQPPEGIYAVRIKAGMHIHLGRAHVAPREKKIHLELLHPKEQVKEKEVEIIF